MNPRSGGSPGERRGRAAELDVLTGHVARPERFVLPENRVYLDGNSLGPMARGVGERVAHTIEEEWAHGLIGSWNDAGWMGLARSVGDRIGALLAVPPGSVHVGDSTSVLLFKLMVAALRLRPERRVIVVEPTTFPTDAYVADGLAELVDVEIRWCDPADPAASLDENVALLALTHVDFRTGAAYDLAGLTLAAHDVGALVQWDLCHSTGAMPLDLAELDVDLAVGCSYKYLNGGPGAPAYAYVAPRLVDRVRQPIPGWMGHARPFEMGLDYTPAHGAARLASGTPPVLALSALDAALDAFDGVELAALRAHSVSLTGWFIEEVETRLGDRVEVVTPHDPAHRGSQVTLRHPEAYGVVQALIARGVVGDFRGPDLARFGFAPLYLTHIDVAAAVEALVRVLDGSEHTRPEYSVRNAVT